MTYQCKDSIKFKNLAFVVIGVSDADSLLAHARCIHKSADLLNTACYRSFDACYWMDSGFLYGTSQQFSCFESSSEARIDYTGYLLIARKKDPCFIVEFNFIFHRRR